MSEIADEPAETGDNSDSIQQHNEPLFQALASSSKFFVELQTVRTVTTATYRRRELQDKCDEMQRHPVSCNGYKK